MQLDGFAPPCVYVEEKDSEFLSEMVDTWYKKRKSLTYNLDYFSQ